MSPATVTPQTAPGVVTESTSRPSCIDSRRCVSVPCRKHHRPPAPPGCGRIPLAQPAAPVAQPRPRRAAPVLHADARRFRARRAEARLAAPGGQACRSAGRTPAHAARARVNSTCVPSAESARVTPVCGNPRPAAGGRGPARHRAPAAPSPDRRPRRPARLRSGSMRGIACAPPECRSARPARSRPAADDEFAVDLRRRRIGRRRQHARRLLLPYHHPRPRRTRRAAARCRPALDPRGRRLRVGGGAGARFSRA